MVLDLPEPWRLVKPAEEVLRPGGILLSYLPTIGQVSTLRDALDRSSFGIAETVEILQRSWHVEGQSVRPDHRMVAHTGILPAAASPLVGQETTTRTRGLRWTCWIW